MTEDMQRKKRTGVLARGWRGVREAGEREVLTRLAASQDPKSTLAGQVLYEEEEA